MKIAFVAYDRPNYAGGPIINARRILPEFVKRGHNVLAIIGYSSDYPNARWLKKQGIEVKIYQQSYTEVNLIEILKFLEEFSPDIFIPNISAQGGYAAYWLKKAGIPSIIAHRSDDVRNWCTANTFGLKKWKWQNSAMVCVSEFLRNESLKLNPKALIHTIPSGVPIPLKKAEQKNTKTLNIVYAGRLEDKQKKINETINAFIFLAKKHKNIKFTILGEGSKKKELLNKVQNHKVADRIVFKAKLTGDAYHAELIKNDIICLLSDYEGMPGSIMDGMACGLVPVCTKFNGIDELILHKKNGILVNDRQESFFNTIIYLLNNPEKRKEYSTNARNHIINNYSLQVTVDRWETLFKKLKTNEDKKNIKLPKRLFLPPIPECYKKLGDDQRIKKSLYIQIKEKLRLRTRIKAFLNG